MVSDKKLIKSAILRLVLTVVKFLGLFYVARYLTRDGLRIICYHGFAVGEEYKFKSRLFIRKELLASPDRVVCGTTIFLYGNLTCLTGATVPVNAASPLSSTRYPVTATVLRGSIYHA